jgi:hypothetical protein
MLVDILKITILAVISWAEIHQALLSIFSLLAEFLILEVLVKDRDSRVLKLVNLTPVILSFMHDFTKLFMKFFVVILFNGVLYIFLKSDQAQ